MTISDYLKKTCIFLNIEESEIEIDEENDQERLRVNLTIPEDREQEFFKNNGEGIDALEYLIKLVFREDIQDKRFILDINNFKQARADELITEAESLAKEVIKSGEAAAMRGLNSYERYLVHSAIAANDDFSGLTTFSKDIGQDRQLIIAPKQE